MLLRSKLEGNVAVCKVGKPGTGDKCSFGEGCLILVGLVLADGGNCEKADEETARSLR